VHVCLWKIECIKCEKAGATATAMATTTTAAKRKTTHKGKQIGLGKRNCGRKMYGCDPGCTSVCVCVCRDDLCVEVSSSDPSAAAGQYQLQFTVCVTDCITIWKSLEMALKAPALQRTQHELNKPCMRVLFHTSTCTWGNSERSEQFPNSF